MMKIVECYHMGKYGFVILTYNDTSIVRDEIIASDLCVPVKKYIGILKRYRARKIRGFHFFNNRKDAERCLNGPELLPYLVMKRLEG